MVTDPRRARIATRLDDDEIEAQRQVRQVAARSQVVGGMAHAATLTVIHGLLGQPEIAPSSPAQKSWQVPLQSIAQLAFVSHEK